MQLGTKVGLSPGHTVLDEDPAPRPPKGHAPPNFRPMPNGRPSQLLLSTCCYLVRYSSFVSPKIFWHGAAYDSPMPSLAARLDSTSMPNVRPAILTGSQTEKRLNDK